MCKSTRQAITEALTENINMPGHKTEGKRLDARSTPTKNGAEQI